MFRGWLSRHCHNRCPADSSHETSHLPKHLQWRFCMRTALYAHHPSNVCLTHFLRQWHAAQNGFLTPVALPHNILGDNCCHPVQPAACAYLRAALPRQLHACTGHVGKGALQFVFVISGRTVTADWWVAPWRRNGSRFRRTALGFLTESGSEGGKKKDRERGNDNKRAEMRVCGPRGVHLAPLALLLSLIHI